MKYNADYFINRFTSIPEDFWIIENQDYNGKHCALGHCNRNKGQDAALMEVFKVLSVTVTKRSHTNSYKPDTKTTRFDTVTCINNGHCLEYKQATPKQRILAALYDIKKLNGEDTIVGSKPIYADVTKELAILPVDETADQPVKVLS